MDHSSSSTERSSDSAPAAPAAAAPAPLVPPTVPVADARVAPPLDPARMRGGRAWRMMVSVPRFLIGGGIALLGGAVALFLGFIVIAAIIDHAGPVRVGMAALMALLFPLFLVVKKLRAPTADQMMAKDPRPPVLLLRSFKIDTDQLLRQWGIRLAAGALGRHWQTESPEQEFVTELQRIGPVVAIGKPGERLPKLGAARMYVSQDQWQAKVRELSSRAALTVLGIGETEGLFWEVDRVVREADPTRVLLYEPPVLKERDRIYAGFRARANEVLPKPLPEELGLARYIGFHTDWTPVPLVDLGPLYHRFGVPEEAKRGCLRMMLWPAILIGGAIIVIGILAAIFGGDPDPPSKVELDRRVTAPNAMAGAWFGSDVVVCEGTILVGAPRHGRPVEAAGAVYVFGRDNAQPQRTMQPSNPQPGEHFGNTIAALEGRAVIGTDSTDRPRAYLAPLDGSAAPQELLNPKPPVRGSQFGGSVAIGPIWALVAAQGTGERGTAHLFKVTDGSLAGSMNPDRLAPDARIAASVAIGKEMVLFFGNQHPMAARTPRVVYGIKLQLEPEKITQFELRPDDPEEFGFGNVLATAGDYVVVGGAEFPGTGRAYVFDVDTGERRGVFELSGDSSAGFATSVATNGYLLAVGAPTFPVHGRPLGAVFVYDIKTRREIARLLPPDNAADTLFGSAVAIDGDRVVVGAPLDNSAGEHAGAVYVYRFE